MLSKPVAHLFWAAAILEAKCLIRACGFDDPCGNGSFSTGSDFCVEYHHHCKAHRIRSYQIGNSCARYPVSYWGTCGHRCLWRGVLVGSTLLPDELEGMHVWYLHHWQSTFPCSFFLHSSAKSPRSGYFWSLGQRTCRVQSCSLQSSSASQESSRLSLDGRFVHPPSTWR